MFFKQELGRGGGYNFYLKIFMRGLVFKNHRPRDVINDRSLKILEFSTTELIATQLCFLT